MAKLCTTFQYGSSRYKGRFNILKVGGSLQADSWPNEEMNKTINLGIYWAVKKGIKKMTKLIYKAAEDNQNKTKGLTLEI